MSVQMARASRTRSIWRVSNPSCTNTWLLVVNRPKLLGLSGLGALIMRSVTAGAIQSNLELGRLAPDWKDSDH